MTYRCLLAAFSMLALVSVAPTQEADTPPASPPQVEFVQPAATIEEAMKRREESEAIAREELAKAEAKYLADTETADQQLIGDLKQLAKKAAANGEIADAAKAWEAVIEVDAIDADAADFFRAIGRLDLTPKRAEKPKASHFKRIEFQTASGRKFKRNAAGWVDSASNFSVISNEIARTGSMVIIESTGDDRYLHMLLDDRLLLGSPSDARMGIWRHGEEGSWTN